MKRLFFIISLFLLTVPTFSQNPKSLCEGWTQKLGKPGLSSLARDMVSDTLFGRIYMADADRFGGIPSIKNFAWLDPDTHRWHALGNFDCSNCGNAILECLTLDDSGHVYIGGFFDGVEDNSGNFIASKNVIRYNPYTDSYEPLAFGLEANRVYSLAWRNDTLFAGGRITFVKNPGGDEVVSNVALFDENTQLWREMGQGIGSYNLSTDDNGDVHALEVADNGYLYAGGRFSKINGIDTVFSMARWSPAGGWEAADDNLFLAYDNLSQKYPPLIYDLEWVPSPGNQLFATGVLGYNEGGDNILAKYENGSWSVVSGGGKPASTGAIYHGFELHYDQNTSLLYIGGDFNTFDDDAASPARGNYLMTYHPLFGGPFSSFGDAITKAGPGAEVSAITHFPGKVKGLYLSGNFTEADSAPVNYLANLSYGFPNNFTGVGHGAHEQCDEVFALAWFPPSNSLIVCGKFSKIGDVYATGLAAFDDDQGFGLFQNSIIKRDFFPPEIHDIHVNNQGQIYVAGIFDTLVHSVPNVTVFWNSPGLTRYDATQNRWSSLVLSLGGRKTVYAVSEYRGQPLMGGDFDAVDGNSIRGLGLRDTATNTWHEFAQIGGGQVRDILVLDDSLVYIGGTFSTVNGQNIAGIAVFDGANWSELGQNFAFYDDVYTLGWDSLNNELIVGGNFDRVQQSNGTDLMTQGLAFWDGTTWFSRGAVSARFTNPAQYAAVVRSIASRANGEIFIGGEFSGIGGVNADRIAHFIPGAGWQGLMDGGVSENACYLAQNPSVNAISLVSAKNRLYLGGNFNQSGNEQAGKFASYGLGSAQNLSIIDSLYSSCGLPIDIFADTSFRNFQWSTGETDDRITLPVSFMDVREKWVSIRAEKGSCTFADSLLLEVGKNVYLFPQAQAIWFIDSTNMRVGFSFDIKPSFYDSVYIDFDDGTRDTFNVFSGPWPDTFQHSYTQPGTYIIRYELIGASCSKYGAGVIADFTSTGIEQISSEEISLFPNPSAGIFMLKCPLFEQKSEVKISLLDMHGKTHWCKKVPGRQLSQGYRLHAEGLSPGIYLLWLDDGQRIGSRRLIIK